MTDLFKHSMGNPFHVSVGAVLVNSEGKIRVHRAATRLMPPEKRYKLGGLDEAYLLMRESLENCETLEAAVKRGLKEEFGAEGEIRRYIGSIQTVVPEDGIFEKTTLYFEVILTREGQPTPDTDEAPTDLEWVEPAVLVLEMREQGRKTGKGDLDESKIIESYIKYGVA